MKFSIKKKITHTKNKNKIKLQEGSLNKDLYIEKDYEKIGKTSNKNNIENIGEYLEESPGSKKENKMQIQEEPKDEDKKGDIEEEEDDLCNRCKQKLDEEWKKPHWKWNLDNNIKFCLDCYNIKETEYEKILNYCILCDSKLKFLRYNPRPEWKIKGQLCRKCWDSKNSEFKSQK